MLKIRLSRAGAKKRPYYHIVVSESRMPRNGRYVESIGFSNPMAAGKEKPFLLNEERYAYWTSQGAQATDTVLRLIRQSNRNKESVATTTS